MKKQLMRPTAVLADTTKVNKSIPYYFTLTLLVLALLFFSGCQAGHCPAM